MVKRTRTRGRSKVDAVERTRSRQTGAPVRQLNKEQAEAVRKAKRHSAEADHQCCACGCGTEVTPGSRFKPGHDTRLKPNSRWRRDHPELFDASGGAR
jgi:hypothetical protein